MSNVDPIGTQGLLRRPSDLDMALEGGSDFTTRLQLLAAKKDAADSALRDLNIGNDIKAALADAQSQRADAENLHEKSVALVAEAKKEAERIVNAANASAQGITDAAAADAKHVSEAAEKTKADADAYAAATKEAADSLHREAEDHNAAAGALRQSMEQTASDHAAAIAAAEAARAEAETTRATLQAHIDKLHGVLRDITG